ncbi:MAG: hypothetical protein AAGF07_03705 [Patescibacteria group bacterium]
MSKKVSPSQELINELSSSAFFHQNKNDTELSNASKDKRNQLNATDKSKKLNRNLKRKRVSQIDFSKSSNSIEAENLEAIIRTIKYKKVGRGNIPIRMTEVEKQAVEEFIENLYRAGVDKNSLSISKLMRICTRYMITNHTVELKQALLSEIVDNQTNNTFDF